MSAPDVAESSRAREEAEQEPESSEPQRKWKWVALVSVPVLHGNDAADDERAGEIFDGANVRLDLNDPPLPSYLLLSHRIAPYPRRIDAPLSAYILAALDRSACILFKLLVDGNRSYFFLCDTDSRTVNILPPVSYYIQETKDLNTRPHLSIGLIADPHRRGEYVVAVLYPTTSDSQQNSGKVLYYSTAKSRWFVRGLALPQDSHTRNPFSETGVLAHDGRLWWIALAYGVFFCDPCTALLDDAPQLRFLPLPDDCEMHGDVACFDPRIRTLLEQRRCVRPSEGKLRFVEIRGLSYHYEGEIVVGVEPTVRMWTLDDPEGGPNPWTLEYEVAFAEIWDSETYADAGLPPRQVPHVALVDPNDHYVVYFFQGPMLFGLDMREKKVVACQKCLIDRDQLIFPSSRPIVDAWVQSPPPPPTLAGDEDDSAPDDGILIAGPDRAAEDFYSAATQDPVLDAPLSPGARQFNPAPGSSVGIRATTRSTFLGSFLHSAPGPVLPEFLPFITYAPFAAQSNQVRAATAPQAIVHGSAPIGSQNNSHLSAHQAMTEPGAYMDKHPKFKSKICKYWKEAECLLADQCGFAHGEEEVVKVDPRAHIMYQPNKSIGEAARNADRYKTILCNMWHPSDPMACPYGVNCLYAHGPQELRFESDNRVPAVCPFYLAGKPCLRQSCPFRHLI